MGEAVRTSSCRYWGATEGGAQGREQSNSGAPGRVGAGCPGAQSPNLLLGTQRRNRGSTSHLLLKKTLDRAAGIPGSEFLSRNLRFPHHVAAESGK